MLLTYSLALLLETPHAVSSWTTAGDILNAVMKGDSKV